MTHANDETFEPRYACPVSRAPLTRVGDYLQTANGSHRYPIENGVPNLLQHATIENEAELDRLDRLNEIALKRDWRTAVEEVWNDPEYVTASSRVGCLDLLDLKEDSTVLEVGASLGQFTTFLSERAGTVYGLEVVRGQAHFAAERCRQEGCQRVSIATGGDDCRLPYPDDSFDVVILSLVLEWCATRDSSESTENVQQRMLSECARVLRKGGQLYLSTKNRYALRFFLGKPDEHAHGLAVGNALPSWLLDGILRAKGRYPRNGKLHSLVELERMIRRAGFSTADSYWAVPEMRYPEHFVPTDAASIREARRRPGFVQGEYRSTRFLMSLLPAPLVKFVTPGLVFLAKK